MLLIRPLEPKMIAKGEGAQDLVDPVGHDQRDAEHAGRRPLPTCAR